MASKLASPLAGITAWLSLGGLVIVGAIVGPCTAADVAKRHGASQFTDED